MKNYNNLRTLAALLAISAIGVAHAQETISYAADSLEAVDAFGDVNNFTYANATPAVGGYNLGTTVDIVSLTLTEIATATWASEFQIGLRNGGFPGLDARFQPSIVQGYDVSVVVDPGSRPILGALVGSAITSGSIWTIEVADTFNDGPADVSEQTGTNFVFSTTSGPAALVAKQTWTVNGDTIDAIGDPNNTILNLGTHTGAPYKFTNYRVASGTITQAEPATFASEARVLLRNSGYPTLGQQVQLTTTGSSPLVTLTATDFSAEVVVGAFGNSGTEYHSLWGQNIATGSSWTAELYESFDDSFDLPESTLANVVISSFDNGTNPSYPTAAVPAGFIDLGVINSTTAPESAPLISNQAVLANATDVRWFKFTIPAGTSASAYVDITLIDDNGATTPEDTDCALFDADGRLIAANDDGGPGFLSQFTIGGATAPRPAIASLTGGTIGLERIGNSALGTIAAGSYYLAVANYDTDFKMGFVADTAFGGPGSEPFAIRVSTNIVGGASISGNLALQNTADDGNAGTESITWTLSNGVNTYTGSVSVNDFGGGAYSFSIPGGAPNGAYTLRFKGGTFLASKYDVVLNGSNLTQNASLRNGNVDQDTEVGPGDFEAVVAQFGNPGDADCDNDGEVGPSDFEIVNANFSLEDE